MSSLKFMHDVKVVAISKMQLGRAAHGEFDPFMDKQNLPNEGICEAADSINYAIMEQLKVLGKYKLSSPEAREELLRMLDNIAAASLLLGVQWCEYEAALKERMQDDKTPK